jgi:hypothetical protein
VFISFKFLPILRNTAKDSIEERTFITTATVDYRIHLIISENLCRNMLKVGPIIMVDSFFRASVLGKALGLTAQAVISHCLTEKHLLIMTADPECLWAYLKDLGNDQG